MNPIKTGSMAAIAGGLLFGISGAVGSAGTFAASGSSSQPAAANAVASTACAQSSGDWTDCIVTLNQIVSVNSEVAAAVPSTDGTVSFCDNHAPLNDLCSVSGNTAVFTAPEGYAAGTELTFSILGNSGMSSDSALAQKITVTSGSPLSQATLSTPGS